MEMLFNFGVRVFVIISAFQTVLKYKYSSYSSSFVYMRAHTREHYLFADISFRHQCCVEMILVGVWFWCLCLDCRGHERSRPSVTQTICMLLKSVAQTGLWWMLFSVIMSRHGAGCLLSLCESVLRVCARTFLHAERCVQKYSTRALSQTAHCPAAQGFKSSISCLQCLRFPVLDTSPLGDLVIVFWTRPELKIKHPCFGLIKSLTCWLFLILCVHA